LAGKKSKSKNRKKNYVLELILWVIISFLAGYFAKETGVFTGEFGTLSALSDLGDGKAYFHFIDVGQGDSTLITTDGGAVVIDTGSVSEGDGVVNYINHYAESVDYLILTHPHEDHMGCAAQVIRNVDVKNVIMPAAASDAAYFSRFLDAVEEKNINVIEAVPGDVYTVGEMKLTLLAPLEPEYENVNNYSVVTRVDVGETSAMFTGDAEKEVEKALLEKYAEILDCDLYQAGHHGSSTSNTRDFVGAVSPSAVIISCGKDNSYGHPHREVLTTFEEFGVQVFRTDLSGGLIFVSDGVGVSQYK